MQEKPGIVESHVATATEQGGLPAMSLLPTLTPRSGWRRWSGHAVRVSFWLVVLLTVLIVASVALTRFWLIPNADSFRPQLVQELSRLSGQRVVIGGFQAGWNGWSPELTLTRLQMLDTRGRLLVELPEVNSTISWRSLIFLEPRLTSLTVRAPRVVVRRTSENTLTIAGIDVDLASPGRGDATLPEWLLKQRLVQVVGGEVDWVDDWRQLPMLPLKNVNIRMQNSGDTHRLGMSAIPPRELAAPLDIRFELVGRDVRKITDWDGLAYVRSDYANLGALTRYLPLPIALTKGEGGLQAWFEFDNGQAVAVTTDLVVRGAQFRFPSISSPSKAIAAGPSSPTSRRAVSDYSPLDLASLSGRLSWRSKPAGAALSSIATASADNALTRERWSIRDVHAVTVGGLKAPPVNGEVLVDYRGDTMLGGEIRLSNIELAGAATVAKSLPINADLLRRLQVAQPTGTAQNINVVWRDLSGTANADRFAVDGSAELTALTWKAYEGAPGVGGGGLFGSIKGSLRAGEFKLAAAPVGAKVERLKVPLTIDLGKHFEAPLILDQLHGSVKWKRDAGADGKVVAAIEIVNAEFENADAAGRVSGTWRADALGPGIADLTGTLSRAEATAIHRYFPASTSPATRNWLRQAVLAGSAQSANFQVKGPLWHFPFRNDEHGTFELNAQLSGGKLDYADRWSHAENIITTLAIRGTKIEAQVASATIAGVPIGPTVVKIADTLADSPLLEISGAALGSLDAQLRWAATSEVNVWLDGFLQGAKASGPGRLLLDLKIPLNTPALTKVSGELVFAGNLVELGGEIPALENVTGVLRFSERDVRGVDIQADALGGPLKVSVATVDGRITARAAGSATFERLKERYTYPLLDQLTGTAQWTLEMVNQPRGAAAATATATATAPTAAKAENSFIITATTVQPRWPLDAMFQVGANPRDSTQPIRATIARTQLDRGRDRIEFELPGQLHSIIERSAPDPTSAAGARVVERAVVDIGGQKTVLPARGYSLRGEVTKLDADAAIGLLSPASSSGKKAVGGLTSETSNADFVNVNVRATEAIIFGQRINEVQVRAQPSGQRWRLALRSKEATGVISLDTDAKTGAVDAVSVRLQRFSLPATVTPTGAQTTGTDDNVRWPKLDLTADSFVSDGRDLGKLEMRAQPGVDEWRIEQVKLTSADGSIEAHGRWQPRVAGPTPGQTAVDVSLNWSDAGKFMARFGLPKGVDRAAGSLTGSLTWAGSPAQFSYGKLAGRFTLETAQGRFTEMEPGIAKLLGVLSLQSLPRRLSFNFDDIFGKGFAFDEVKADVTIKEGVASTDGFLISGPSARVQIRGTADMNHETQALDVRLYPSLSTATAIGIGLATANPAIGAAVLLGQKLAKDPIERFLMQEFEVKGTWAKPEVKQASRGATPNNEARGNSAGTQ